MGGDGKRGTGDGGGEGRALTERTDVTEWGTQRGLDMGYRILDMGEGRRGDSGRISRTEPRLPPVSYGSAEASAPVDCVRTDIGAPDGAPVDVENCPKVGFDADGVDSLAVGGGELVNFVGAEPGVERVFLENVEGRLGAALLAGGQLRKRPAE